MAKIIRLTLVLTIITVISGLALSYVHKITEGPIKITMIKEVKAPAVLEVFKDLGADNDFMADLKEIPIGKDSRGKDIVRYAFPAKKGGKVIAVAIEAYGNGYHEGLGVMTAIGVEGEFKDKIIKIAVTSSHETPGKGDRVTGPGDEGTGYRKQYVGRSVAETIEGLDGISGATMTCNGMQEAVNKALEIFKANKDKIAS
jgi:Na+-translocating ferredoxin:NAD+ oxidoreductase subunit G